MEIKLENTSSVKLWSIGEDLNNQTTQKTFLFGGLLWHPSWKKSKSANSSKFISCTQSHVCIPLKTGWTMHWTDRCTRVKETKENIFGLYPYSRLIWYSKPLIYIDRTHFYSFWLIYGFLLFMAVLKKNHRTNWISESENFRIWQEKFRIWNSITREG